MSSSVYEHVSKIQITQVVVIDLIFTNEPTSSQNTTLNAVIISIVVIVVIAAIWGFVLV